MAAVGYWSEPAWPERPHLFPLFPSIYRINNDYWAHARTRAHAKRLKSDSLYLGSSLCSPNNEVAAKNSLCMSATAISRELDAHAPGILGPPAKDTWHTIEGAIHPGANFGGAELSRNQDGGFFGSRLGVTFVLVIRVPRLFVAGIFSLIVSPALAFSSRMASTEFEHALYAALAVGALGLGCGLSILALALGHRRESPLPEYAGYVAICAVIVAIGGFVLALNKDPTVFLATLVGALAGGIITKLEALSTMPVPPTSPSRLTIGKETPKTRRVKRLPDP
ncbi:MAG TPA: hypothetical protein VM286_08260 [Candidatus Thermoplasmatota archaeon]|nr:hypothetical protein [Candidatus Thermoplasmatota archaeon]